MCLGNANSHSTLDLMNGMVQETRTHSGRSRALPLRSEEHSLVLDALHLGSPRKASTILSNRSLRLTQSSNKINPAKNSR